MFANIENSTGKSNSGIFVEFMLDVILNALKTHNQKNAIQSENIYVAPNDFQKVSVKVNANQQKILACLKNNPYATMEELSETIGIAKKNIFNNMKKLSGKRSAPPCWRRQKRLVGSGGTVIFSVSFILYFFAAFVSFWNFLSNGGFWS